MVFLLNTFIPQNGVHTYNTRLSSKGAFVIPKVTSHGLSHSATTGVYYGTHYHMLLVKFRTFKIVLKQHLFSSF